MQRKDRLGGLQYRNAAKRCRTSPKLLPRHITHTQFHASGVLADVAEKLATEALQDTREHGPDLAGVNDTDGSPVKVETQESIQRDVSLANAVVGRSWIWWCVSW